MSSVLKSKSSRDVFTNPLTSKISQTNLNRIKSFLTLNEFILTFQVSKTWNNNSNISTYLTLSPSEMHRLSQLPCIIFKYISARKVYEAFMIAIHNVQSFTFLPYTLKKEQINELITKLESATNLTIRYTSDFSMRSFCSKSLKHLTLDLNTTMLDQPDVNIFWSQPSLICLKIFTSNVYKIFQCDIEDPCPKLINLTIIQSKPSWERNKNKFLNSLLSRLKSLNELTITGCDYSELSSEITSKLTYLSVSNYDFKDYQFLNEANKLITLQLSNTEYNPDYICKFDSLYETLRFRPKLENVKMIHSLLNQKKENHEFLSSLTRSNLINITHLKVELIFKYWINLLDFTNGKYKFKQLKINIELAISTSIPEIFNIDPSFYGKSNSENRKTTYKFLLQTKEAVKCLAKHPNVGNVTLHFQDFVTESERLNLEEEDFALHCLKYLSSKITCIKTFTRQKKWTKKIFQYLFSHPLPNCTDIQDLTFPRINENPNRRQILRQLFPALKHYQNITLID